MGSVVPLVEYEPSFGRVEIVDVPDTDFLASHRAQYRCKASAYTLCCVVVHRIGCVLDGEVKARFEDRDQGERVVSRVGDLDSRNSHPGDIRRGFERRTVDGI
ncbi:hypothetical protein rerp_32150 [Rhodococcus erythropolis]|nr:hypothetical protein rerp_32150 [Rhodococcus erythropolis]